MRIKAIALGALLLLSPAAHSIDFTPARTVKILEKARIPVLTFHQDGRQITYQPPGGWSVEGGPDVLELMPPNASEVKIRFQTVRMKAEDLAALADQTVEDAWARQFVPRGADNLVLEKVNPSPFMLGAKESREWVFKFSVGGRPQALSVARCDVSPRERFLLTIYSDPRNFDNFRSEVISSLFSWTFN